VADGGGGWRLQEALEGITARVLIMPSETDQFFDVKNGRDLKRHSSLLF
jgi:homoserine acetyltransferase